MSEELTETLANCRAAKNLHARRCEAALARVKVLEDELSACKESPGGCGYWREAAKLREQERDAERKANAELRAVLERHRSGLRDAPAPCGAAYANVMDEDY